VYLSEARKHDSNTLAHGLRTKFWCCQDKSKVAKAKKLADEKKQRDRPTMDRFECHSKLSIAVEHLEDGLQTITVRLSHHHNHQMYFDVRLPKVAEEVIAASMGMSKPAELVHSIQRLDGCSHVTASQVHRVWRDMTKGLWYRAKD
jgi:hypothetical protein